MGTLRATLTSAPILTYYTGLHNWGDALNPVLVESISGQRPIHVDDTMYIPQRRPIFSVIGSILGTSRWPNTEVWGSGFIAADRTFACKPRRIHAVRGPLSRDLALSQGVSCPEVYGDPALLYPRFYTPGLIPTYDVGLIPHYVDREAAWVRDISQTSAASVIDVLSGVREFVDAVCKCRVIASSSLHGIIAADAYGIPFVWIELSDRVIGDRFKFHDYFASTGRRLITPVRIRPQTSLSEVLDRAIEPGPEVDLDRLMAACPFAPNGSP